MIQSIAQEIIERRDYLEGKAINTIYFGGGTPSLLTREELTLILQTIREQFAINDEVEISLEANPDDITVDALELWKSIGVNRLSIGLQSFRKEDLEWMNRAHSVEEATNCVHEVKQSGFENITVDLIYGLPNLSLDEWEKHVQTVIDFQVPHISAYCLTIEKGTALNNWVNNGKIVPASEDQQSDQFNLLVELLEKNGYQQYEISNFAKPGYESRHNSNYWKGEWYLGVGPSAHSFNGVSRAWNVANNQRYIKAIESNDVCCTTEILSPENQFNEYILTGLRTVYGVELRKLKTIAPLSNEFTSNCDQFIQKEWMLNDKGILVLTKEGRLRADHIAAELFMNG